MGQKIRPYIMALYTLKDEFISLLKVKDSGALGEVEEPKMTLKNDGTQELTFSIPMYIRKNGELIENPAWYTYDNSNLVVGMRKIKVIFGEPGDEDSFKDIFAIQRGEKLYINNIKGFVGEHDETMPGHDEYPEEPSLTLYPDADISDFKIFEFIITKITESHSEGIMTCEVESEGLPFHELGKTGYKLSFNKDSYENEYSAYFDGIIAKEGVFASTEGFEIPDIITSGTSITLSFREVDSSAKAGSDTVLKSIDTAKLELNLEDLIDSTKTYDFSFNCENETVVSGLTWEFAGVKKALMPGENTLEGIKFDAAEEKDETITLLFHRNDKDVTNNAPVVSSFMLKQREEVKANINYWVDKVIDGTKWTYEIDNDWSNIDGEIVLNYENYDKTLKTIVNEEREEQGLRRMDTIYEDEFVAEWTDDGAPLKYEKVKEKERVIEADESNRFNILVDIAEKFEVAIKFIYEYDRYFRIIGRKIVFYNSVLKDKDIFDITYPYDASEITRELDCNDIVTKMYVKTIDDDTNLIGGKITIADSPANKTQEDYILNFNYLYDIGTISKEQYDEVKEFENAVATLNTEIKKNQIVNEQYKRSLAKQEGIVTVNENKILEANERIKEAKERQKALTSGNRNNSNFVVENNVKSYAILYKNGKPYINIGNIGIVKSTLKIYKENPSGKSVLPGTISYNSKLETDEAQNLTIVKLTNVPTGLNFVYPTYEYKPSTYYAEIIKSYEGVFRLAVRDKDDAQKKVENYKKIVTESDFRIKKKLKEKEDLIRRFERIMGPAIREGNWQDEEYIDLGNRKVVVLNGLSDEKSNAEAQYIIDLEAFDNEQKAYFEYGETLDEVYYPYIDISSLNLSSFDNLFLVYNNYWEKVTKSQAPNAQEWRTRTTTNGVDANVSYKVGDTCYISLPDGTKEYYKCLIANGGTDPKDPEIYCGQDYYGVGSELIPAVLLVGTTPKLVLLFVDETRYTKGNGWDFGENDKDFSILKFAEISAENRLDSNGGTTTEITKEYVGSNVRIVRNTQQYPVVYPRIIIKNMLVKIGDTDAPTIYINDEKGKKLTIFEDYESLPRYAESEDDGVARPKSLGHIILKRSRLGAPDDYVEWDALKEDCYCLTIRPNIFLENNLSVTNTKWTLDYKISNAATSIYLDAQKVSKINAYPQVSYTVKVNAINKEVISKLYDKLNQICHINDYDLKFQHVRGYISEIVLDLNAPWEDEITINNYKTKFEDLFSTIVASAEQMKTNGMAYERAANCFLTTGAMNPDAMNMTIAPRMGINPMTYNFEAGKLTISEENGIWAINDDESGVVAFRGGGISIANSKDAGGEWIWHTGITPEGINASLLNAGQLNIDKIIIYAGNNAAYQMNGTGLYAYREIDKVKNEFIQSEYVVHNGDGLFLVNEPGTHEFAIIEDGKVVGKESITIDEKINLVEVSWDGFVIRNYKNEKVFYADTEGNLTLAGTIKAKDGYIGDWIISDEGLRSADGEVTLSSASDTVFYVGGEENSFSVTKEGIAMGTSILVSGAIAAQEAVIDGVPMTYVVEQVGINSGIFATPLLGDTFTDNTQWLSYLLSSYDIDAEMSVDNVFLQQLSEKWELVESSYVDESSAIKYSDNGTYSSNYYYYYEHGKNKIFFRPKFKESENGTFEPQTITDGLFVDSKVEAYTKKFVNGYLTANIPSAIMDGKTKSLFRFKFIPDAVVLPPQVDDDVSSDDDFQLEKSDEETTFEPTTSTLPNEPVDGEDVNDDGNYEGSDITELKDEYYTNIFVIDSLCTVTDKIDDVFEIINNPESGIIFQLNQLNDIQIQITQDNAWWREGGDTSSIYFGNKKLYEDGNISALKIDNTALYVTARIGGKEKRLASFSTQNINLSNSYDIFYNDTDGFWFTPYIE